MDFEKLKGELNNKDKFRKKPEETNPCYKENSLSLKCLDDNYYDRDKCTIYFENYKKCKAFWGFVYKDRKRKGIKPFLPPPEERSSAKEKYLPYFKG